MENVNDDDCDSQIKSMKKKKKEKEQKRSLSPFGKWAGFEYANEERGDHQRRMNKNAHCVTNNKTVLIATKNEHFVLFS